jgi:hypothetical protein
MLFHPAIKIKKHAWLIDSSDHCGMWLLSGEISILAQPLVAV